MQAALRRTSDCLFSMRSYRASCTRTSRSRTLFPIPLPPVASSSSSLPDSTAPSHQLTRTVPLHWRATSLSSSFFSSFLHFSRSLDSFPLLRFRCSLVHALSSSLSLSLSSSLRYRSSQLRSFSFSRATTSVRESPRVYLLFTLRSLDYLLIHETKKVCVNTGLRVESRG